MKRAIILALFLCYPVLAQAGSATINTDAATDARLQAWTTAYCGIQSPTAAQVKQCLIILITRAVQATETQASAAAITPIPVSQMN
jgi:hypothetical protein